jgi:hypothetical protein
MGSPLAVSYITADQPAILERSNALPELSRIGTGAEPSRPQRRIYKNSPKSDHRQMKVIIGELLTGCQQRLAHARRALSHFAQRLSLRPARRKYSHAAMWFFSR